MLYTLMCAILTYLSCITIFVTSHLGLYGTVIFLLSERYAVDDLKLTGENNWMMGGSFGKFCGNVTNLRNEDRIIPMLDKRLSLIHTWQIDD